MLQGSRRRRAHAADLDEAYTALAAAEAELRAHRARCHEVTSTLAGIRSASDLLSRGGLDADRAHGLQAMMNSELHRLERVLHGTDASGDGTGEEADVIEIDAVLRTLVAAHEAKGTTVTWATSGELAIGSADDVAQVVNVLLDNAARHGDAAVTVDVRPAEGAATTIEILVSDSGPGIAPDALARLFEWGGRGAASPGQGIGLHTARELMDRHGGYLRLLEPGGDGRRTTFAVGVAALRAEDLIDDIAGQIACEIELGAGDGVPA